MPSLIDRRNRGEAAEVATSTTENGRRRRYRPAATLGGRGAGRPRRTTLTALAFLAPAFIVLGVFNAWPMLSALITSFTDASGFGDPDWVGVENYVRAFTDPDIRSAMLNTVWYTVLFAPTAVLLALGLAMLVNSPNLPFRGFFRTSLFIPFIVSLAVAAFAWSYLLDPQVGLLNYWLSASGIRIGNVLQDPVLAMPVVAMVAVWKNFGFYFVVFLAGLQDIPVSLYEAARVDGAGPWTRFRHITLPMLSNTFAFVLIFAMIASLQAFDQIYVMTGGGPYGTTQTVVMEIYTAGFRRLELGFASALSYILLLATLVISLVQFAFFGRKERDLT